MSRSDEVELICGDAARALKRYGDDTVDSVITDPPSGTNMLLPFRGSIPDDPGRVMDFDAPLGRLRHNFATLHKVNLRLRERFGQSVWPVLGESVRVLKPGGYIVVWALHRTAHWVAWGLEEAGASVTDLVLRRTPRARLKSPLVNGAYSTQLVRETEVWVLARKPGETTAGKNARKWGTGYLELGTQKLSHLIEGYGNNRHETDHPAEKSVEWMRALVRLTTPLHGVVLDPFMGSGSTGVAARLEDRKFIGIEQDKAVCKGARRRLNGVAG
jgi:site-specific DNA-methyltransferase (adenine-specific)